jgi:hypothetical protein
MFSNPLFNAAPAGANGTPAGAANPYMNSSLFQSAPMPNAPIQNVIQPTAAPQPVLTPQQQIQQYMAKGHK